MTSYLMKILASYKMASTNNYEEQIVLEPLHITDITPKEAKLKHRCRPLFGISFAVLSSFMLVLMYLCAKLCNVLPVFELGVFRFVVLLAAVLPNLIYFNDKVTFSWKIMILLILRGFTGTCGMVTQFYAVQNMPALGDATVLGFTTPVFVALFARIILKERLHWIYGILLLLSLAGVTMIARPTFIFGHPADTVPEYENILVPSLLAVLSAVTTSASLVLVRVLLTHKIKQIVIIFYLGLVGLVYSTLGSYFDRGFQFPFCQSLDYLYALGVGIFGLLFQLFLTEALRYDKAFIVSIGCTSGIVFGFLFQVIIFSLIPSSLSLGGAAIITLCNIVIFFFKWYQYKKRTPNEQHGVS